MPQIYFTSDLHFGHSNILKHSPKRPYSDTVDIAAHDEWLLDIWQALYEYLSSLRDKPFIDTRSDVQKLESAGFDKKTSFRNIK